MLGCESTVTKEVFNGESITYSNRITRLLNIIIIGYSTFGWRIFCIIPASENSLELLISGADIAELACLYITNSLIVS